MSVAEVAPRRLEWTPLSEVAGAVIVGLDLSQPLEATTRQAILEAFLQHRVLVFRAQALSREQQAAFTQQFGPLEEHVIRLPTGEKAPIVQPVTNLDAEGRPTRRPHTVGNYFWHTDKSYHAVPSLMTLLHAVELPAEGGDTQFANMALAYRALPPTRQRQLAKLKVVHSWEANRRNTGNRPATAEEIAERPPVTHPLVRTHPETGEKVLYLGYHVSHVVGMPENEGRKLLFDLLEEATQPEFVYSHKWRRGDLVIWDNRCLLHRAVANYAMERERRVLHRTVVRGSVPY
jgi:alpha-ketoglutarate-dependent 2,4-dichlorophenoxyacetate dioxygenase